MVFTTSVINDKNFTAELKVEENMMNHSKNIIYLASTSNTVDVVYHNRVNTSYPLHTHAEHDTLGVVLDGEIEIETDTEKYVCKSNHIFAVPLDVSHSIKPCNNSFYTMLSLCIHQEYLVNTDIDSIQLMIEQKLEQIFCEIEALNRYSEMIMDGLLLLLANKFRNVSSNGYFKTIKNKLIEIPELPVSIEEMSNEVCISSFHMIRQFKKEIGLTPHQFQIQCRIRKAQKMLLGDKTIAEVALETGFCDQSHFVKCFKKIVGMPPAAYKKVVRISKEQE